MKKLLLTVVAIVSLVTSGSFAQNKMNFGVGADIVLPMGNFSNAYGIGFGGTVRGQYMVNEMFSAMATTGYLMFTGKDLGGGFKLDNSSMIPILVGGKYYFMPSGMRFYGAADLGITIWSQGVAKVTNPITGQSFGGGTASSSEFTFQPQVGFESPLGSGNTKIDVAVRYMVISGGGAVAARVGLLF